MILKDEGVDEYENISGVASGFISAQNEERVAGIM